MIEFLDFSIQADKFQISFVKSSGAGGQNVNKLSTKAVLRWRVIKSSDLPAGIKARFIRKWKNRISKDGYLVITSDKYRHRARNIDELFIKIKSMVECVYYPPKKRKKSRPSKSSVERRIKEKKIRSTHKRNRRKPDTE
jgi:ribosome-associated protein